MFFKKIPSFIRGASHRLRHSLLNLVRTPSTAMRSPSLGEGGSLINRFFFTHLEREAKKRASPKKSALIVNIRLQFILFLCIAKNGGNLFGSLFKLSFLRDTDELSDRFLEVFLNVGALELKSPYLKISFGKGDFIYACRFFLRHF